MKKVNTVSVLETTLQLYDAEKYLPVFKKYGIDTKTLALLNEVDLRSIGIADESLVDQIVKQCKNLPKRKENKYEINEEFISTVLKDIEQHLRLLHASLSICLIRQDVQISDIKLKNSVECFSNTTNIFGKELQTFRNLVVPRYVKKNNKWKYIIAMIVTSTASVYTFKKYFFA